MFKKVNFMLLLSIVLLFSYASSASALVNYGSLYANWYASSSVTKIGFFSASDIKIYLTKNSNWLMTDANFSTYATYSASAWSSVTGKTSSGGTSANYVMGYAGIGRSDANSAGIPSNALGATTWQNSTLYGYGTVDTTNINVYSISKSLCYMIWDSSSGVGKTSNFTAGAWKNVFAHEFGHGMGYDGHSANSTKDLMWESTASYLDWGTIGPTIYDSAHMGAVY